MTRIVVAGVVNVRAALDVESFPVPFTSSRRHPNGISVQLSGTGFTIARTLRDLGADVTFATYVGADPLGLMAVGGLREQGLYGPAALVCESQPRAVVLYDRNGSRANTTDLRTTPSLRYPAEVFASIVDRRTQAAVLTNIGFTRPLIPAAVERGIPIVTDLHVVTGPDDRHSQAWMRTAHVLACSHEGLTVSPEAWIEEMWQRYGVDIVIVGCGADGAVIGIRCDRATWHVQGTAPRGVRYTSGAGDALVGAFVHHYFSLGDPVAALRHAVLLAGWKVGGLPDRVDALTAAKVSELSETHGLPPVTRLR
jgi:sugar/nucleoside kinase (ribokinase family)